MLGAEEFGVPISQIQEIDRLGKITKVPNAAQFIEGVTNLRGEVIPVLDTRRRFELEAKPSDDRTRIIIVDLSGVKTGLVVDSVREVLNLAK
jgi:purine-binding chemotaxis protein CheW